MNKLQGKDLINVGIFTAIYFVVMMAIAMLGFIPIFLPLLIVLVPLIGGIVMMLYYSKVQKFGMVSLTGLICGILMLLTGMGYWSIITGAVFGVLADLVLKSGDYKSAKKRNHIAWCFFYVDYRKLHPHCCNTGQLLSAANQRLWTRVCRFHYELYLGIYAPPSFDCRVRLRRDRRCDRPENFQKAL